MPFEIRRDDLTGHVSGSPAPIGINFFHQRQVWSIPIFRSLLRISPMTSHKTVPERTDRHQKDEKSLLCQDYLVEQIERGGRSAIKSFE